MISVTVHCDADGCEAWAFAGSGFEPKDVDHGEFDLRSGWIDDTWELPDGWQRDQRAAVRTDAAAAASFYRCPAHAVIVRVVVDPYITGTDRYGIV